MCWLLSLSKLFLLNKVWKGFLISTIFTWFISTTCVIQPGVAVNLGTNLGSGISILIIKILADCHVSEEIRFYDRCSYKCYLSLSWISSISISNLQLWPVPQRCLSYGANKRELSKKIKQAERLKSCERRTKVDRLDGQWARWLIGSLDRLHGQ